MVNYNVNTLGGLDLGGLITNVADRRSEKANQADLNQQRQLLQEDIRKASSGDVDAMNSLMGKNPKIAMLIEDRNLQNEQRLGAQQAKTIADNTSDFAMKWVSSSEEDRPELLKQALANPLIDFDEEDAQTQGDFAARALIFTNKGKDFYKELVSGGGESSLPAEAVAFNDLIKDFSPKQQKTAKLVKAGLKGRAMSNAELSAIESGDIKNYADWKAKMKQQQKFAELTGSSRAKAIDKGFDKIVKIKQGIGNIDRAISAINRGAGVGAVEKLWPSIKSASVELDNIRGQMALDVIGSTTFGALSEGELGLAKDIAMPTGLDTEELKVYLNDKKLAQEKLTNYFNEQIQFLDQGGTVAGFLRQKESQLDDGKQPRQTQPDKQGGQIMTDANGNKAIVYPDGTFKEL